MRSGVVHFVGAGPGPVDLLTVRAMRLLQEADMVAYDELVEAEILKLTKPNCELLAIGYRARTGGDPHPILHQNLIERAKQGATIVRLKSGDPSIFGRLAEEMAMLDKECIPFTIVPGITAAFAAAAAGAWPLTQKGVASAFRLLTWSPELSVDVSAETLAIYMPRHGIKELVSSLLHRGWNAATPAAYIQSAARSDEALTLTRLDHLEELLKERGDQRPGICLIGHALAARTGSDTNFTEISWRIEDTRHGQWADSSLHRSGQRQDKCRPGLGL